MKQAFCILFIIICGFVSCEKEGDSKLGKVIHAAATIRYIYGPDTCDAYMIAILEKGEFPSYYKPEELPEDFMEDGLSVNIKYQITEETHNCGFGGYEPIIHIVKISKR